MIGYLYDTLDRPPHWPQLSGLKAGVSANLQRLNLFRLVQLLVSGSWDLAIHTHFLPAELIASLRRSGHVNFPHVTVTTDFHPHRVWIHSPCERYFVASEEGRAALASIVPADRVSVTGIPIHPVFAEPRSAAECRRRHGIGDDRPVVLQLSGGGGYGKVERIHRSILDVQRPIHVIVVTGRNAEARRGSNRGVARRGTAARSSASPTRCTS